MENAKIRHEKTGLPLKYLEMPIGDFTNKKILKTIDNFIDTYEFGKNIYLCGKPGTGKTRLITYLTSEIIDSYLKEQNKNVHPMFQSKVIFTEGTNLIDVFNKIYYSFREDVQFTDLKFNDLRTISILVLDDFGKLINIITDKKKGDERFVALLDNLLRYRYHNKLSTFITCQYSPDNLKNVLDESLSSVILDKYINSTVSLIDKNYRT